MLRRVPSRRAPHPDFLGRLGLAEGIPMPSPLLPIETLKAAKKALDDAGGNQTKAARSLGIPRATLQHQLSECERRIGKESSVAAEAKPEPTIDDRVRERRLEQEVTSLKRREKQLLDQVITLQNTRSTVMGLADALEAPDFITPVPGSQTGGKRTAILHISHLHCADHVH